MECDITWQLLAWFGMALLELRQIAAVIHHPFAAEVARRIDRPPDLRKTLSRSVEQLPLPLQPPVKRPVLSCHRCRCQRWEGAAIEMHHNAVQTVKILLNEGWLEIRSRRERPSFGNQTSSRTLTIPL